MSTPVHANKKLGKLAPKIDSRTLKLSKYLDSTALPAPPATLENNTDFSAWGMYGNDTVGDCTIAAAAHAEMAWSDANKTLYTPVQSDIISAYTAVTAEECSCAGYDPSTGANDNGCACIDVLNYWKATGISTQKITGYATVAVHNQLEIKQSIYLLQGLYIGLALPLSAQNQAKRWTVTNPALTGNSAPGSWGGHCVFVLGYNVDGLDLITWGERIRMTWGFWKAYVDEAYVILSPEFFTNGKAPNGFALTALQADLKSL